MKKLMILAGVMLLALVLLLHEAGMGSTLEEQKQAETSGVAGKMLKSGREVGRSAGRTFDSVRFGRKR